MTREIRAQQIKKIIKNCNNIRQLCQALGISPYGGSYIYIKDIIDQFNIDTSHFHTQNISGVTHKSLSLEEILVKGSFYTNTSRLKEKLIQAGLLEEHCAACLRSTYDIRGKIVKMPLQLHHKDGDRHNNELSNLALLCPICHSFTNNNRGKKKKVVDDYIECKDCGKTIRANKFGYCKDCYVKHLSEEKELKINNNQCNQAGKNLVGTCKMCGKNLYSITKTNLCRDCYKQSIKNPNKPSKQQLQQEIKQNSFLALGRKYNVSDTMIRKWCKSYGIDYKRYGQIRVQSLIGLQKGRETQAIARKKVVSICPNCGKPKHKGSKLCKECYYKSMLGLL